MASTPTDPTPPAAVPALPDKIRLGAEYAWFAKDGSFVHRSAGDLVTDADQIAYLVALPAIYSVE